MSQSPRSSAAPVQASTLQIEVWDAESGSPQQRPLPLLEGGADCNLRLRALDGASAIHLALSAGEEVLLRAEVEAEEREEVQVGLQLSDGSIPRLSVRGDRLLFTLPPEGYFRPPDPLLPARESGRLDLIVLVDATLRSYDEKGEDNGRLLEQGERWEQHLDAVLRFVEKVSEKAQSVRLAALGFADEPLEKISAHDLVPAFRLYPPIAEQRRLETLSTQELGTRLARIPSSSGGDFVDALADALDECASARWHPDARKLLLLTGDSPGYSILHPPPWGANAAIRRKDVESVALDLHSKGVEVVSIFHPVPPQSGIHDRSRIPELLHFAEQQYRSLASRHHGFFFLSHRFDPDAAARTVIEAHSACVRGAGLGEFISVSA
ncbi:MAG: vWA domain-containing protein [Acidobacteriota bacterium]